MILVVGVTSGLVGGTAAALNATNNNVGFVATPSLVGPNSSVLTAAAGTPPAITLSWTAATNLGPTFNEYALYRANNAVTTATSCPGTDTSYTGANGTQIYFGTGLSYTDTPSNSSSTAGYLCYMLFAAYTSGGVPSVPVWISHPVATPFNPYTDATHAAPHLPFEVLSLTYTNKAVAGTLDSPDVITITYNQPTNAAAIAAANQYVCTDHTTGIIYVGSNINGGSNKCFKSGVVVTISPPNAGSYTITGTTPLKDPIWGNGAPGTTFTWNNNAGCNVGGTANTVLCVTLGVNGAYGETVANTGWTVTPIAGTITASDGTAVCTTCTVLTTNQP
ncbi:MAG TPA: hypothetical protein VNG93_04070 [Candidatus Dormibacteraeota bacterium]|nr:hypothetical protein [Candidatus Dormibacteraeota bacterium]